jgi:xanthine/uracil permease
MLSDETMMADNVRSVRSLGTTWQRRNLRYWTRRFMLSSIAFMIASFVGLFYISFARGLLKAASENPLAQKIIVAGFAVALMWSTAAAVLAYRPIMVAEKTEDLHALREIVNQRGRRKAAGGGISGIGVGIGALAGSSFAIGLLAFGSVFIVGWPLVMFAMSFRRYYSAEECLAVLESRRESH